MTTSRFKNPYGAGYLRCTVGSRVEDPLASTFPEHDPDEEILPEKFPYREVLGVLYEPALWDPLFLNIGTGAVTSSHHDAEGGQRNRDSFFDGVPPRYNYCLQWMTIDGVRVRCLQSMRINSQGCGVHKAVLDRGCNVVFTRMKLQQKIYWRDIMDPLEVEKIFATRAKQALRDKQWQKALDDTALAGGKVRHEALQALKAQWAIEDKAEEQATDNRQGDQEDRQTKHKGDTKKGGRSSKTLDTLDGSRGPRGKEKKMMKGNFASVPSNQPAQTLQDTAKQNKKGKKAKSEIVRAKQGPNKRGPSGLTNEMNGRSEKDPPEDSADT